MITITIKGKKHAAGPVTMGLQKALARYSREAMAMAKQAKQVQESGADVDTDEGLESMQLLTDALDTLNEMRAEIVLRAFENKITPDELDEAPASEIDRVVQELQASAYGIVRKNA